MSFGWARVMGNWKVLCTFTLALYAVNYILRILTKGAEGQPIVVGVFGLLSFAVSIFIAVVCARIALIEGKGTKTTWKDLAGADFIVYVKMFLLMLLLVLIIAVIGLLAYLVSLAVGGAVALPLGVLVGAFVVVKLRLSSYAVADGMGPIAAIKASFKMTENCFWQMLGLVLLLSLANIAGAIVFLIGLIVTIPLVFTTEGYVYQALK